MTSIIHFPLFYKSMPAAEPNAMMPNSKSPAFEDAPCVTPTALAAPVESAAEVLALPLSLIVPAGVDCAAVPLPLPLLAASGSVEFLSIWSKGGLQITISTLLLRHSPRSKKL
jgi:hypothetical protein